MKTTIIMPCIRVPQNLSSWMQQLNPDTDEVIIAGNVASPHDEIENALIAGRKAFGVSVCYLHPQDPRCTEMAIQGFVPPNSTVRRNFALLEALRGKPDVLLTLDDDNFPFAPDFLKGVKTLLDPTHQCTRPLVKSNTGWWNAGELCKPSVIHRGFPVSRWREVPETTLLNEPVAYPRIGVVASLWHGDPDINAVERMLSDPFVNDITGSIVMAPGTWCPFDSQSTSVAGDLAAMMYMWPGVGRYDDIWSSYMMRAVMDIVGRHVTYGRPAVQQDRNPHQLTRDLRDELHGYEFTEECTDFLRRKTDPRVIPAGAADWAPYDVFHWLMTTVAYSGREAWLPSFTQDSFLAWLSDVDKVVR